MHCKGWAAQGSRSAKSAVLGLSRYGVSIMGASSTPNTILLATDLSSRCDRALDRAVALAAEWNARLLVLHVLKERSEASSGPSWWQQKRDPKERARARVQRDLRGAEGVDLEVLVEQGDPEDVILRASQGRHCGLIVTGVASDETFGRALLGSTVDALVRRSEIPVLIVKSRPTGPYQNVMASTDFSEGSRAALGNAATLFPKAKLSLFHAFDLAFEGLTTDKVAAYNRGSSEAFTACRSFIEETPETRDRVDEVAIVCRQGDPGEHLQDLVEADGSDLIVLGTEGRTGLARMLVGSVAQRLLASLSVDALVVRRPRK